jgi:general secretion pathway protein J
MTALDTRQRGFTLLELLVAITLLGVLMAALFGALRLGARVWENGEARLDASARVQVVQNFVRQQLGQTVPLTAVGDDPRAAPAMVFVGTSGGLRFVSLLPAHLGGGVSLMELALRPSPDGGELQDLMLRMRPLDLTGDGTTRPEPEERVLIAAIASFELAYFGVGRPGAAPVWWQEWEGQQTLPALVRMRIGFPERDRRRWPELIVALMVDLPPAFQL